MCEPEDTAAEDPMMIIYTSGTTGKPKGIAHTHTGFPTQGGAGYGLGTDVQGDDVIFWFTDLGWMMGPWLYLRLADHWARRIPLRRHARLSEARPDVGILERHG